MTTVLVVGVFDGVHEGHKDMLRQARAYGDRLVAVIATDANVRAYKRRPVHGQEERKGLLAPYVDEAVIGTENDFLAPLLSIRPDVICLGYDQHDHLEVVEEYCRRFPKAKVIRLEPYFPERYKSSRLHEGREGR